MKRMLFLAIFAMSFLSLWAQPSVTRNDLWAVGETADYLAVDATNAEAGPSGTGVVWDYSHLPRISGEDYSIKYDSPSVAPNAGQFPEATMVAVQDAGATTGYTFFKVTDGEFRLEGLDLPDLGVVTYSDKNIWMNFPFSYGESYTDPFIGTYVFNFQGISGISNRSGEQTTVYDGYGTLILPTGERIENVRRIRSDLSITDEVNVSGLALTTVVETTTYNFFAEGEQTHVFHLTFAESTASPPGITIESKVAAYRSTGTSSGGGGTLAARRGTHLTAQGGDFDSEILIRNPTSAAQSLTLHPFLTDGSEGDGVPISIAAGATSRVLQQQYFSSDTTSFSVTGCDECIFSVGYRADIAGSSTAQVHQNNRFGNEFFFYPGEWDILFDGAAIVNVGDGPAHIEATQLDNDGNPIGNGKITLVDNLASGSKHLSIFNSLFQNNSQSLIKLESDQPMAVMILRISDDGRFLYQNMPLPEIPEQGVERWITHITNDTGGFDTDIYVTNSSGSSKTVTLHPYAIDGTAMATVDVTVPGDGTRRFTKAELFDGDVSHALITGEREALVTVGYRSKVENSSTAVFHEGPAAGTSFYLYPGEWDVLFDGVALVNTGNAAASITVTQINDDGTAGQPVTLTGSLAPNAKFVDLLQNYIPENAESVIKVESTQPLSVLALRLSGDSRFLYSNNILPQ